MKSLVALFTLLCITTTIEGNPYLLYSTSKYIKYTNITKGRVNIENAHTIIEKNFTEAPAFDYHYQQKKICWSDHGLESIQCDTVNDAMEAQNQVEEISSGVAGGLACDWYTNKLYWTDSEVRRIEVATMDGLYRKVLIWTDLDQPRAIKLAPMKGLMFWTDWGEPPKIERSSMDGNPTSRKIIVSEHINWPNGLAIDYENELIYWVDAKLYFLDVVDFDGKKRSRMLAKDVMLYPFSLSLFKTKLFWTDWSTWSIYYHDMITNETLKTSQDPVPTDIKIWDQSRQPYEHHNCLNDNGGCSHLCLLSSTTPYGYSCACPIGIKLITNTTCASGYQELLLIARRDSICLVYLDTPDLTHKVMQLNVKYSIAVDYDPVEDFIYWSDDEVKKIQRAKLDGSLQQDVVTTEIFNPDGIAIDWIARNIYWTDAGSHRVEMCRLDQAQYRKVIVSDDLVSPRAIAVAPHLGWLFWSDWNKKKPKVERSNLDGSHRIVIVSHDLEWPNGITLDFDNDKIYWCDAKKDKIEFANFDGSARMVLISNDLPHPFGFSVMGDYIYWTDWQKRTIERAHKDTGDHRRLIVEQMSNMMGLKAIKIGQPLHSNPCGGNNGGCDHLCLYRHNSTRICACELGYELKQDRMTCVKPESFLLYSKPSKIGIVTLRDDDYSDVIPVSRIKHASSVDYDINTKRIYWTDSKAKAVMRAFINGSEVEEVVAFGLGAPSAIAIDWLALNVYWTDSFTHRIEVARLVGTSRKTLLWEDKVYDPRGLVLDPPFGYMYWSEWKSNCIKKAAMDGSNPRQLHSTKGHAADLTLDYQERRLYWIETETAAILSSDLNGNDKSVILKDGIYQPIGLAVFNDVIYWYDSKTGYLMNANKLDGSKMMKKQKLDEHLTDLIVYQHKPKEKNSCSTSNGGCTHLCLAVPSKSPDKVTDYVCACPTHYSLKENECVGPNDCPEAVLPIYGLRSVKAISFDPLNNFLYWIEGRSHAIKRAEAGGTQLSLVVVGDDGLEPHDLVVDPIGRLLFWTCTKQDVINITRLEDGAPFGVVQLPDREKPTLLAIHPSKRLLFYTDTGETPQLVRMRLDGTHRVVITKGGDIVSIAVDPKKDLVVWAQIHTIFISNIDGESRLVLHNESNSKISQLAIHDGWVYWVDRELSHLQRLELQSGNSGPPISLQTHHIIDIISVTTFDKNHPCFKAYNANNCTHLCILNGTNPVCACPRGGVFKEDKKSCVPIFDCGPERFTCAVVPSNEKDCMPIKWKCDKQPDCHDGSDEANCHYCGGDEFKCTDGNCIPQSHVCDGTFQCADKSDEENCCKDGFSCSNTGVCLSLDLVCDKTDHCADGSDEHAGLCANQVNKLKGGSGDTIVYLVIGVTMSLVLFGFVFYIFKNCSPNDNTFDQCDNSSNPMQQTLFGSGKNKNSANVVMMSMLHSDTSSYDRNNITGASSSTNGSSQRGYPRETLNPPPSPATTAASTRGSSPQSRYNRPYRHYRSINQPPPPTPCSTDVCDESEYNFPIQSRYEGGPFPPPPTPRSHCQSESCPPSPSSRSSTYFSPLPPPPSPVATPPHRPSK